ncbi:MAG: hypothetical protein ACYTHJ_18870 [Planctomycetota bacterium]
MLRKRILNVVKMLAVTVALVGMSTALTGCASDGCCGQCQQGAKCGPDCDKPCCKKAASKCPEGCEKPCCKKA